MHPHSSPTFTATPNGILINALPLDKSASQDLPPQTLRYVKRAEELLAKVKKEDWDCRTPHALNDIPILAQAQMMLALASPQVLEKAGFRADQPRDDHGRWAREGVTNADRKNPRFKGMDPVGIKKQKFVDAHLAAAEKGAKQLNVPVENLLALSALESGWGRGDGVVIDNGNNFFGLQHPATFEIGFRPARNNPDAEVAQFASYYDSMRSFIKDYGYIVQDTSDPTKFASNLQNSGKFGINSDDGSKVPNYVDDMVGTIKHIRGNIAFTRGSQK